MQTIANGQSAGKQVVFKELPVNLDGYESKYKITNDGRIYSEYLGDFLKPFYSRGGYVRVKLNYGNRSKKFMMHRLVAMAFIPNPDNKPVVDHINRNRADNRVEIYSGLLLKRIVSQLWSADLKTQCYIVLQILKQVKFQNLQIDIKC